MRFFLFIVCLSTLTLPSFSQSFLPFGEIEYYIEKDGKAESYDEAETKCNKLNATLAIVNSEAIQEFLADNITNSTGKLFLGSQ